MKTKIEEWLKFNSLLFAWRTEHWSDLLIVVGVLLLSVFFLSSAVTNVYQIGSLIMSTQKEKAIYMKFHERINLKKDNNAEMQMATGEKNLFGSMIIQNTNSRFTILGISYSAKDPSHASVIISSNTDEEKIYHVGDKLPGGASIESITQDRVTIFHNGVMQTLLLKWEDRSDQPPSNRNLNFNAPKIPLRSSPNEEEVRAY